MNFAPINWDAVELLPERICCVCRKIAVPWGRTLHNEYFCSKGCCEAGEAMHPDPRDAESRPCMANSIPDGIWSGEESAFIFPSPRIWGQPHEMRIACQV
jgi:hypothetical protein